MKQYIVTVEGNAHVFPTRGAAEFYMDSVERRANFQLDITLTEADV